MKIIKSWEDGFDEALNRIVNRGRIGRADVEAGLIRTFLQTQGAIDDAQV